LIVYTHLRGRDIYNACSPTYEYQVTKRYKAAWWTDEFKELRELMAAWFYELFEHHTGGHYSKLRESVAKHGFINPIIVTSGTPLRRKAWMVPDHGKQYICEQNGGSRLKLAQDMDVELPCIVNGAAPGEVLETVEEIRSKFGDKTYRIKIHPTHGAMSFPDKLLHLGEFSMSENQSAVRVSKDEMIRRADDWLRAHGY